MLRGKNEGTIAGMALVIVILGGMQAYQWVHLSSLQECTPAELASLKRYHREIKHIEIDAVRVAELADECFAALRKLRPNVILSPSEMVDNDCCEVGDSFYCALPVVTEAPKELESTEWQKAARVMGILDY